MPSRWNATDESPSDYERMEVEFERMEAHMDTLNIPEHDPTPLQNDNETQAEVEVQPDAFEAALYNAEHLLPTESNGQVGWPLHKTEQWKKLNPTERWQAAKDFNADSDDSSYYNNARASRV